MSAAHTLSLQFRDDPDFVDLVTHRLAHDRVEVDIEVADMRCANCAGRIEHVLNTVDGVTRVRTNPAQRRLVLDYDPGRIGLRSIFQAIADRTVSTPPSDSRRADSGSSASQLSLRTKRRRACCSRKRAPSSRKTNIVTESKYTAPRPAIVAAALAAYAAVTAIATGTSIASPADPRAPTVPLSETMALVKNGSAE
jgi:copper chaperone CopZ